jgi:hypothetical protein
MDQALSGLQSTFALDHHKMEENDDLKKQLSARLAVLGYMEAAEKVTKQLTSELSRAEALMNLSNEMARKQRWEMAEQLGQNILVKSQRLLCWEELGRSALQTHGPIDSLQQCKQLQSAEARTHYLKGWTMAVVPTEADPDVARAAIPYLAQDLPSLEQLLQMYALNQIYFQNPPIQTIQRLTRTLDIQWALDNTGSRSDKNSF